MCKLSIAISRRSLSKLLIGAIVICNIAIAGTTDISNIPVATTLGTVKPNLFFLLDDSGTMPLNFLPAATFDSIGDASKPGYLSAQCNGLAYNPALTYTPPVDSTGALLPNAPLISGTYYTYFGTQAPMSWAWVRPTTQWIRDYNSEFAYECKESIGRDSTGKVVFQAVSVTPTSAEAQNYANWQQYYSTRMTLMTNTLSRALFTLDASVRVGLGTISSLEPIWNRYSWGGGGHGGPSVIDMADFTAGQKSAVYGAITQLVNGNITPTRGALSKVGQYYANRMPFQVSDPVQYSCQKNFALVIGDGGWSATNETSNQPWVTPNFGPYQIDNTTFVGDQDGTSSTPQPMYDASNNLNTLADVAAYYYSTDLRTPALGNCTGALGPGFDVCTNNVAGQVNDATHSFGDAAKWQHMTTFVVGLGTAGTIQYTRDYLTNPAADFANLVTGAKQWPPIVAQTSSGPWTNATLGMPEVFDDLWHTAVDGRGQYYAINDMSGMLSAFQSFIAAARQSASSGSAATISSLFPTAGNNDLFAPSYSTGTWTGDVLDYKIDPTTGSINTSTPVWSARAQLDVLAASQPAGGARTIFYRSPSGISRTFTLGNLVADGLRSYFLGFCSRFKGADGSAHPQQCASLSSTDWGAANGLNGKTDLLAYLRGDNTMTYFRQRKDILGDIVDAAPVYVSSPNFQYKDSGYAAFVATNASRKRVVVAAANDGMVHAFDAASGIELWAYIPLTVMPNLYKLADFSYGQNHSFFVDATPVLADVYDKTSATWRTIIVGGLGAGGRSYYALDITDPTSPKPLWEFKDTDLGLTFGNPIVTKRSDGTWIVAFTSGYNNVLPGDGNGHLYVVDAMTGSLLSKIDTRDSAGLPVGTSATPSGLGKLNDWVTATSDNTAGRFYAGDLLGGMWRFDIGSGTATLIANATSPDGQPQSISSKPALAQVAYQGATYPIVAFVTGRLLGTSDVADPSGGLNPGNDIQSVYVLRDPLPPGQSINVARTNSMVSRGTFSPTTDASGNSMGRSLSLAAVNWSRNLGWMADFPVTGERNAGDPTIAANLLTFGTNIPINLPCNGGGNSYLYSLDYTTGGATIAGSGTSSAATYVGSSLIGGVTVVQLQGGSGPMEGIINRSDSSLSTTSLIPPRMSPAALRRQLWRELLN